MTTKSLDLIETIRNALTPQYKFPYYALVRVHTSKYGTFHIPAPMFDGMTTRSKWAGTLPIAQDKRDNEYYECPFCDERSFFSGICQDCYDDLSYGDDISEPYKSYIPIPYMNHEVLKASVKEEFLHKLDSGIQSLGITYAEIVLPVPYNAEWDPSPFLKCGNYSAQFALDRIEKEIRAHEDLKKHDAYQEMIKNYTPKDGIPLDYIEWDVITVEGSTELRRHGNEIWQHKHPDDGYDYWHPMARIHKNSL